jgi:hypothetical protein
LQCRNRRRCTRHRCHGNHIPFYIRPPAFDMAESSWPVKEPILDRVASLLDHFALYRTMFSIGYDRAPSQLPT